MGWHVSLTHANPVPVHTVVRDSVLAIQGVFALCCPETAAHQADCHPLACACHIRALTAGSCCRADALANLTDLDLSRNALKGTLSPFWGDAGGFVSLQNLDLSNNSFSGQLPLGWGSNGTFPVLVRLLLSNNSLSGTLPGAWGTRGRWPLLAGLYLQNNDLTGVLASCRLTAGHPDLLVCLTRAP